MNIYYEINRELAGEYLKGHQHWVQYDVPYHTPHNKLALMYADKVWEESRTGIQFVKNRFTDIRTLNKDELKEFM